MTRPDHWPRSGGCWQERWQRMTGGLWWHSLLYSPHSVHSQSSLCYPQLCSPLVAAQHSRPCQRTAGPCRQPDRFTVSVLNFRVQTGWGWWPGQAGTLAASDSGGPGLRRHGDPGPRSHSDNDDDSHGDTHASDKHGQLAIKENGKIGILVWV